VQALDLIDSWPVENVAAAVISPNGAVDTAGDQDRQFRIASVAKPITTWACLVAVEEGIVALDQPVGQPGCTLRHLLSHAGGYPFDGAEPIAKPESTRIYSNTGIEIAAQAIADAAGMSFEVYLSEAVFQPLGMTSTSLQGSPAHRIRSSAADLVTFLTEVRSPTLISQATAAETSTIQFPELSGIVPGVGRYSPCPWGVGFEIRGSKQPHWTGTTNSPSTFGHFGGAGTFIWVDPAVGVACLALTDRPFDEWAKEALQLWPVFDDAVLAEASA
jgi:CubicO group peptidase (beta-lactamase class C family)